MDALIAHRKHAQITLRATRKRSLQQSDLIIGDGVAIDADISSNDGLIDTPPAADQQKRKMPALEHFVNLRHPPDNHGFLKRMDWVAVGQPIIKPHKHAAGLTTLMFQNCVIKIRVGDELNQIIILSKTGEVHMLNLFTKGWEPSNQTLLPAFIFEKYLSSVE